jgi:hypothetical protein
MNEAATKEDDMRVARRLRVFAAALLLAACADDANSEPTPGQSALDAAVVVGLPDAQQTASADAATPSSALDGGAAGARAVSDAGASRGSDAGDATVTARDATVSVSDAAAADAGSDASAPVTGPCDLYASGGTPCVAAHSTVRAMYGAYQGPLYQVRRASDQSTKDIGVLSPGGFANAALQDTFCMGTTCTFSILYDQSPKGNHLRKAPAGGAKNTPDSEANATALKLLVGGHSVYAVRIDAGMGYRNNKTSGVATGDQPEGEYMVTSGKRYNGGCCFDYGNAETSNNDDGNGTMEAIYFGNNTGWGKGGGSGPWVMADLENGLFAGQSTAANTNNTPLTYDYVSAMLKGKPGGFALKGGNAQSGALKTMYDGARPANGYNPMKKQGAIILGIGGDNSNGAIGSFFEGCMTSGYPTDASENAVQENIVAAGYGR